MDTRNTSQGLPLEYSGFKVRRTFLEVDEFDELEFDDSACGFQRAVTEPVKVVVNQEVDEEDEYALTNTKKKAPAKVCKVGTPEMVPMPIPTSGLSPPPLDVPGAQGGRPFPQVHGIPPKPAFAKKAPPSYIKTTPSANPIPLDPLRALQEDPDLADVFQDLRENGMASLQKYYQDEQLMLKICRKMAATQLGPNKPPAPSSIQSHSTRDSEFNRDEFASSPGRSPTPSTFTWSRQNTPDSPPEASIDGHPAYNDLEQQAPTEGVKSAGSVGHPFECGKECIFYFWRSGCKAGLDCRFCHEFHPRQKSKKNRRALRRFVDEGLAEGIPQAAFEDAGLQVPLGAGTQNVPQRRQVSDDPTECSQLLDGDDDVQVSDVPQRRQVSDPVLAIETFGYSADGGSTPGAVPGKLVLPLGLQVQLPACVQFADGLQPGVHAPMPWLRFAVQPPLPKGLLLDERSGLISGAPEVEQASSTYTFIAGATTLLPPIALPGAPRELKPLATCELRISTVNLQRYTISWGSSEPSANGAGGTEFSMRLALTSCLKD